MSQYQLAPLPKRLTVLENLHNKQQQKTVRKGEGEVTAGRYYLVKRENSN